MKNDLVEGGIKIQNIIDNIKQLNDTGILDLIAIIISPIISFTILFFTLRHDKKQFKIQIVNQQKQHQENIGIMIKQHEQDLNKQTELNRIAIMPYLLINKDIKVRTEEERIYFEITFINKGNGTAIELTGKYLNQQSDSYLCLMFESIFAVYGCACPFDYETSVVNPGEKCAFEMYQEKISGNINEKNFDKVTFKILYKDMYFNLYEQEFMFLFSKNQKDGQIEIQRVSTYSPQVNNYYRDEAIWRKDLINIG